MRKKKTLQFWRDAEEKCRSSINRLESFQEVALKELKEWKPLRSRRRLRLVNDVVRYELYGSDKPYRRRMSARLRAMQRHRQIFQQYSRTTSQINRVKRRWQYIQFIIERIQNESQALVEWKSFEFKTH